MVEKTFNLFMLLSFYNGTELNIELRNSLVDFIVFKLHL